MFYFSCCSDPPCGTAPSPQSQIVSIRISGIEYLRSPGRARILGSGYGPNSAVAPTKGRGALDALSDVASEKLDRPRYVVTESPPAFSPRKAGSVLKAGTTAEHAQKRRAIAGAGDDVPRSRYIKTKRGIWSKDSSTSPAWATRVLELAPIVRSTLVAVIAAWLMQRRTSSRARRRIGPDLCIVPRARLCAATRRRQSGGQFDL